MRTSAPGSPARPDITLDREEITVVEQLPHPEIRVDATEAEQSEAAVERIRRVREDTRGHRILIAGRPSTGSAARWSWRSTCGSRSVMFTKLSVSVVIRLRQTQRLVLDTLVDTGVAPEPERGPA